MTEEAMKVWREAVYAYGGLSIPGENERAAAAVIAAAMAADKADAARYRWLRDHSVPPHNFYISVPDEFHGVQYTPAEVDAYIDAARATLTSEADNADG